jgi:hypothetical protein
MQMSLFFDALLIGNARLRWATMNIIKIDDIFGYLTAFPQTLHPD